MISIRNIKKEKHQRKKKKKQVKSTNLNVEAKKEKKRSNIDTFDTTRELKNLERGNIHAKALPSTHLTATVAVFHFVLLDQNRLPPCHI